MYNPFKNLDEYINEKESFKTPLYPIKLDNNLLFGGSVTSYGLQIAYWIQKNSSFDDVLIDSRYTKDIVFFKNKNAADLYNNNKPAVCAIIFKNKNYFHNDLEENGNICIVGSIMFPSKILDESDDVTQHIAEMYFWLKDNLIGDIYRWDGKFYFTNEQDLMHFKLKWC